MPFCGYAVFGFHFTHTQICSFLRLGFCKPWWIYLFYFVHLLPTVDILHALNLFDHDEVSESFQFTVNCFALIDSEQLNPLSDKVSEASFFSPCTWACTLQDDELLLKTEPITLLDLRSAYHLVTVLWWVVSFYSCSYFFSQSLSTVVVSFHAYLPEMMVKACHTFGMAVELCDIPSKHVRGFLVIIIHFRCPFLLWFDVIASYFGRILMVEAVWWWFSIYCIFIFA